MHDDIDKWIDYQRLRAAEQEPGSRRALIVEDDTGLQTIIQRIVKSIHPDMEIVWATNLGEAHLALKECKFSYKQCPDLILTDIYLPGLQMGTALWDYCMAHFPGTPFVFMSSSPADSYLKLFENPMEVPPFISKPFTVSQCKKTIEAAMEGTTGRIAT